MEDKRYGVPRIDHLRQSGAVVKFLSVEPLLEDLGSVNLSGIDWMIVGGESGPGARAIDARWVRRLRRQCRDSRVKFFFKQWGGVRKHETGRVLDGRTYDEFPARCTELTPDARYRNELIGAIQTISSHSFW